MKNKTNIKNNGAGNMKEIRAAKGKSKGKSKKSGTGKIKVSPWTKEEQDKKKNNKKKEQEKINMKWASTII